MSSIFGGGGSSSTSFSGLRGTPLVYRTMNQVSDDFGTLRDAGRDYLSSALPALNESGLLAPQQQGMNVLGQNLLSSLSSSYARMGLNTPQNINAVVGGALTQAAPSLMGQVYQNIMGLDAMRANRFGAFNTVVQSGLGVLGQESSSRTTAPGLGYATINSFSGGFGQGLGQAVGKAATGGAMGA